MTAITRILASVALLVSLILPVPAQAIINGQAAATTQGSYDFAVALVHSAAKNNKDGAFCGGTMISKRHVVTAAHCVANFDRTLIRPAGFVKVVAGDTNLDSKKVVTANIATITVHPGYDQTIKHDLAIITTDRDLPGTPARLATKTTRLTSTNIVGFGAIAQIGKETIQANELQMANVTMIANDVCSGAWAGLAGFDSQLCAQGTDGIADTCVGDSGSALYMQDKDGVVLAGVASFGAPQCGSGVPSVYGSVVAHAKWIADNTVIPAAK